MTAFNIPKDNCVARDLFDALTILHDLDMWDDWVYEYAEDPQELIRMVNEDRELLFRKWEKSRRIWQIKINSFGTRKIAFVKMIRNWLGKGFGLYDAKYFTEHLPAVTPWGYASMEEAENSKFMSKLTGLILSPGICGVEVIRSKETSISREEEGAYYSLESFGIEREK